jgi:hypothetical protein
VSLSVIGYSEDGKPIYGELPPTPKLKRCVVRNLGRVEQILACAERLLDRHDVPSLPTVQGAAKNA